MITNRTGGMLLAGLAIAVLTFGCIYLWSSRGYGKVSPHAYKVTTALYNACLTRSDARLDKVEKVLAQGPSTDVERLSAAEQRWLETIIRQARRGNWESATKSARRLLEDQVEF